MTRFGSGSEIPRTETVQACGEPVVIDVRVEWADYKRKTLRVCATASGPSTWMMQRLDESFDMGPGCQGA